MKILVTILIIILLPNHIKCQSWQQAEGIPDTLWIYDLATFDPYVFAATMYGIYRSDDAGCTWEPKNNGISPENTAARAFARSGNTIYVSNFRGVFCTTDYGENWTDLNLPYQNPSLSVFADDSIVLAGVIGGGLYRSTDYGTTWTGLAGDHIYKIAKHLNYYFAGSWFEVLVSEDYGITWNSSGMDEMTYWVINFNDTIYACPFTGGLVKTFPAPINWEYVSGIAYPINGITTSGDSLFIITNDYIFYRFENDTERLWHEIPNENLPLAGGNFLWSITISGNHAIVGTENNDGTGAGVWYCPLHQVPGSLNNTITVDQECLLSPNPAVNFLTLKGISSVLKISIYNISGTQVLTLYKPDETIDIGDLATGVYTVKIETDSGIAITKFIKY